MTIQVRVRNAVTDAGRRMLQEGPVETALEQLHGQLGSDILWLPSAKKTGFDWYSTFG